MFLILHHFFWRKRNGAQRKHVRVFRPEIHHARFSMSLLANITLNGWYLHSLECHNFGIELLVFIVQIPNLKSLHNLWILITCHCERSEAIQEILRLRLRMTMNVMLNECEASHYLSLVNEILRLHLRMTCAPPQNDGFLYVEVFGKFEKILHWQRKIFYSLNKIFLKLGDCVLPFFISKYFFNKE